MWRACYIWYGLQWRPLAGDDIIFVPVVSRATGHEEQKNNNITQISAQHVIPLEELNIEEFGAFCTFLQSRSVTNPNYVL